MNKLIVIGGLMVTMALAACGSTGTSPPPASPTGGISTAPATTTSTSDDSSTVMQQDIMTAGATQIQANANKDLPGATVTMNDAQCVQTAGTQEYTCIAHYTVVDPSQGLNQKYVLNITGTCDASATCQWHASGPGSPVG